MASFDPTNDELSVELNRYFTPILSAFACPFCSQKGTYLCQIFKPSVLNFSCSKSDPCFSSMPSPHFFSECRKQGIDISASSASQPIKSSRRGRKVSKSRNSFSMLLPDSPLDRHSWGDSVRTSDLLGSYDEAIFQFSSELGSPERGDKELDDPDFRDILDSNKLLVAQISKLHELNEKLLTKLQIFENETQLGSYSPTLPSYNQNTSSSQPSYFDLPLSLPAPETSTSMPSSSNFHSSGLSRTGDFDDLYQGTNQLRVSTQNDRAVPSVPEPPKADGEENTASSHSSTSSQESVAEEACDEINTVVNPSECKETGSASLENTEIPRSINYVKGHTSPSLLQRAEHSCKKIELGTMKHKKGGISRQLAAIEIHGVLRQPFKTIKCQFREIGIPAEMTPSLHFVSSQVLEVIVPQWFVSEFISSITSQKAANLKPFKSWNIASVQEIRL